MSVSIKNILFTTFVFGLSSGPSELGEARKTLLICKAWRGLGKDYSFVRSLDKEYSWYIKSQQELGAGSRQVVWPNQYKNLLCEYLYLLSCYLKFFT